MARTRGDKKPEKTTPVLAKGEIDRGEFVKAIEMIRPGITNSQAVEQFSLILFSNNRMISYNNELAISVPFKTDIEGGVAANELYELLKKLKSTGVTLENTGGEVVVSTEKTRAGFKVSDDIEIPDLGVDEMKESAWFDLPENFMEAVGFCLFSAATDLGKGVFTCLNAIDGKVESCDNFRLTRFDLKADMPEPILLPRAAATILVNYAPIQAGYSSAESWVHFRSADDITFSTRIMDGEYPNLDAIIETEGDEVEFAADTKDTLGRAEIFASGDDDKFKKVHMEISKGAAVCRAEGPNGWIEEKLAISYKGNQTIKFDVTPSFLVQIIDKTKKVTIGDRLCFEGKGFIHVVTILT